jgi:GrpB-like predicted nucleotidyltransferase (UPF0157 family)
MINRAMNVTVTDYDDEIIEIHHIGSTAVPNLKAKPIIDIMPINLERRAIEWRQKDIEKPY